MITTRLRHTFTPNPETKTPDIGLANRLFQIAAGIGYAKKYNDKVVFPDILHKNYDIHRNTIFRNLNSNGGSRDFIQVMDTNRYHSNQIWNLMVGFNLGNILKVQTTK